MLYFSSMTLVQQCSVSKQYKTILGTLYSYFKTQQFYSILYLTLLCFSLSVSCLAIASHVTLRGGASLPPSLSAHLTLCSPDDAHIMSAVELLWLYSQHTFGPTHTFMLSQNAYNCSKCQNCGAFNWDAKKCYGFYF